MKSIALLSLILPTVSGFVSSPWTHRAQTSRTTSAKPTPPALALKARKSNENPSNPSNPSSAESLSSDVKHVRQRLDRQFAQDRSLLHEPKSFDLAFTRGTYMYTDMDVSFIDEQQDQQQKQKELEWDRNYQRLKSFHDKHGNVRIPVPRSRKGSSSANRNRKLTRQQQLYDWCQEQRQDSLLMRLDDDKATKLLRIGFFNDLVQAGYSWNQLFQVLLQFYVQHGHSNVPPTCHHLLLAQWVYQLRRHGHLLSAKKRQLLWSVNFCWSQEEADFDAQYRRLRELQTAAATAIVKQKTMQNNCPALGQEHNRPRRRKHHPQLTVRQWKKIQQKNNSRSDATNDSMRRLGGNEVQGFSKQETMTRLFETQSANDCV